MFSKSHVRGNTYGSVVMLLTVVIILTLAVSTALADTVVWEGNGAHGGICETVTIVTDDPTLLPGTQRWTFILTKPTNGGTHELTAEFSDGPNGASGFFPGQGGGSVHFEVYAAAYATLLSASATDGDADGEKPDSNLVVSHCEVNPPLGDWCSPGYWRQLPPYNAPSKANHSAGWAAAGVDPQMDAAPFGAPGVWIITVLNNPQIYGGTMTNAIADFLSAAAGLGGTQDSNSGVCPL